MATPETGLTPTQLETLTAPTPESDILTRSGGSYEMSYVTGEYVKRTLLETFGGDHTLKVLSINVHETNLILHLSLEYPIYQHAKNGSLLLDRLGHIEEFGSASLARNDYGQAIKAAFTDALKRAGTHLGIALDLYHKSQEEMETKKSSSKPAWAQVASKQVDSTPEASVTDAPSDLPPATFSTFTTADSASAGQKGFIMKLCSDAGNMGDAAWLAKVTGFPLEKLGKCVGKKGPNGQFAADVLPISKADAKVIIDTLKGLNGE